MTITTASQNVPVRQARRIPRIMIIIGGIVGLLVVTGIALIVHMSYVPDDLNTATVRLTDNELYQISYIPELEPLTINQIHTWTIQLESVDGLPVEDAQIFVDGGMPQHGHGLPTAPQVTQYLGNGSYLVEGLKFNMTGWWVVSFEIQHGEQTDTVTFNLIIN